MTEYREHRRQALRDAQGFSLLEVMTVVAVLGILATFAFPSTRRMLDRQEAKASATQVAGLLERRARARPHRGHAAPRVLQPARAEADGGCAAMAVEVRDTDHSYSITDGDQQREFKLLCKACKKVKPFGEGSAPRGARVGAAADGGPRGPRVGRAELGSSRRSRPRLAGAASAERRPGRGRRAHRRQLLERQGSGQLRHRRTRRAPAMGKGSGGSRPSRPVRRERRAHGDRRRDRRERRDLPGRRGGRPPGGRVLGARRRGRSRQPDDVGQRRRRRST